MTMKKEKSVSVVLPVYNEAEIIEEVIRGYYNEIIRKYPNSEFIIAEDGSDDGTKKILTELSKEIPMRLVMGPERKGYLHGVRDALLLAKNEIVFFSDSDGQHDPRDFWKLLKKIENHDLVCGMRVKRHDPLSRKILTRFYNRLIWFYFGIYMMDTNCGFKMMRKNVVDEVVKHIKHIKFGFSTELIIRTYITGYKISAVPISHIKREHGVATQFTFGRIPGVMHRQISGLRALKKELKPMIKSKKKTYKIDINKI